MIGQILSLLFLEVPEVNIGSAKAPHTSTQLEMPSSIISQALYWGEILNQD